MKNVTLLALALLAFAPMGLRAQAPITVEVPVDLQNLHPDIDRAMVACFVGSELPPNGEEIGAGGTMYGDLQMASEVLNTSRDGSLRTTARIEFDQDYIEQAWLLSASVYRCRFWLVAGSETIGWADIQEGRPATEAEARSFARPRTLTLTVEGTLPGG